MAKPLSPGVVSRLQVFSLSFRGYFLSLFCFTFVDTFRARKRGRPRDEQSREVRELRSENEQLKAQLAQAELIISAQKKLAQALEQTLSRNKSN